MVVTINTPPELLKYIIKKGSIAIDGISLTVTQVTESSFSVSLIPHTAKETTLGFKDVGDSVNLETDIIGKYVEQMLKFNPKQTQEPALNKNMLLEMGLSEQQQRGRKWKSLSIIQLMKPLLRLKQVRWYW